MSLFNKKKDPEDMGINDLEKGVHEFEKGVDEEDKQLRELFSILKTDLLDEFLTPGNGHIKEQHIKILEEQVRHVISVASAIGFKQLVSSFEEEHGVLQHLRDLVEQFPDISVESSPDLKSSLVKLRSMIKEQQSLIFTHEEILIEEKKRLIQILNQVKELKNDRDKDKSLSSNPGKQQYY